MRAKTKASSCQKAMLVGEILLRRYTDNFPDPQRGWTAKEKILPGSHLRCTMEYRGSMEELYGTMRSLEKFAQKVTVTKIQNKRKSRKTKSHNNSA